MHLCADVFIATFGERSVALDLNTSRYIALGGSLTAAARAVIDGRTSHLAGACPGALPPALAALAARGLVCASGPPQRVRAIVMPRGTLWPPRRASGGTLQGAASVMIALSQAQLFLTVLPLGRIVRRLRAVKSIAAGRPARSDQTACLAQFTHSRPWFPARPVCRLDAIALCLHLWRNGVAADLVFGVRIDPFAAHCWVQHDGAALNDAHDFVGQFAPIMAI